MQDARCNVYRLTLVCNECRLAWGHDLCNKHRVLLSSWLHHTLPPCKSQRARLMFARLVSFLVLRAELCGETDAMIFDANYYERLATEVAVIAVKCDH